MIKEERIKRYGEAAYKKRSQQSRAWNAYHPKEIAAVTRAWREANQDKVKANHQESSRKGGKHYEKKLIYQTTGLQGERNKIRATHGRKYRSFKQIIAPGSQIHHEWVPETSEYMGVALVETQPHRYGIIDVIQILEGKITLLSEKEIRKEEENKK